jgi:hypothetical protein
MSEFKEGDRVRIVREKDDGTIVCRDATVKGDFSTDGANIYAYLLVDGDEEPINVRVSAVFIKGIDQ